MSASLFISHATQDARVAARLCEAMEARGFSCWIASRDIAPGENFQVAIVRAIRGAKIMLLVFTSAANGSDEVAKELALASQNKMIVAPLRVENVAPSETFAYEFATRQWIDFTAGWDAAMAQLRQRLAATLAAPEPPPDPTVAVVSLVAPRPPRTPRKRSPLGPVVALILIAAVLAAGAYFALSRHPKPAAAAPAAAPPVAAMPKPAETNDVPY